MSIHLTFNWNQSITHDFVNRHAEPSGLSSAAIWSRSYVVPSGAIWDIWSPGVPRLAHQASGDQLDGRECVRICASVAVNVTVFSGCHSLSRLRPRLFALILREDIHSFCIQDPPRHDIEGGDEGGVGPMSDDTRDPLKRQLPSCPQTNPEGPAGTSQRVPKGNQN